MTRIDAHQHFWRYDPVEYAWIDDSMKALRRTFLPSDLIREMKATGVDGAVTVQARQSVEETDWLLALARENDFIRGLVGWAPLANPNVERELERFSGETKLKGVRHIVQSEPDPAFLDRADFNAGVRTLRRFGLVYDILIYERQLPSAISFADRHPAQIFVLDHAAKPRIVDGLLSPWRENIRDLARRENVYCKISGLVTEGSGELEPYWDVVLEAFGPKRLMFGSDWPVCLAATDYARWIEIVHGWVGRLSQYEQSRIWGRTAAEAYGL